MRSAVWLTRERNAALESLESLFEGYITLFVFRDQRFQFGQRLFEVGEFRFCFHARDVKRRAEAGSND